MYVFLRQRKEWFQVTFKWAGKPYPHSLKTKDPIQAEKDTALIRWTIARLEKGEMIFPPDADVLTFITTGGRLTAKPTPADSKSHTLGDITAAYLGAFAGAANTKKMIGYHVDHLTRHLGADCLLDDLTLADVQAYCGKRLKDKWHGKPISPETIRKEVKTLRQIWARAKKLGMVKTLPDWGFKDLMMSKPKGKGRYRTYDEISSAIERGGLTEDEQAELWECLFLDAGELLELIDHASKADSPPWLYPAVCFAAFTGARRAEILRSEVRDWDFATNIVTIRDHKGDKSHSEVPRDVKVHPLLRAVMLDWTGRVKGRYVVSDASGKPVNQDTAQYWFNRTFASHDQWKHVRGWHVLRHSFASILATKGTPQAVINQLMGHKTGSKTPLRYQHLFMTDAASALERAFG
jgi:integrase